MDSNKLENIMKKAKYFSSNKGMKLTPTRKQVLTTMLRSKKALSAYELAEQVKLEFHRSIPAMSVYRILDVLTDVKLVHKISSVNRYIACSHITCDHKHMFARFLICIRCYKVKELMTQWFTTSAIQENVEASGFQILNEQLELNCLCSECSDKKIFQ
ncbi:MAG: Fur family transcriptional regulator [Oligoflexales bacterium]